MLVYHFSNEEVGLVLYLYHGVLIEPGSIDVGCHDLVQLVLVGDKVDVQHLVVDFVTPHLQAALQRADILLAAVAQVLRVKLLIERYFL